MENPQQVQKNYLPAEIRPLSPGIIETDCLECGETLLVFRGDSVAGVVGQAAGRETEHELKGLLCERCSRRATVRRDLEVGSKFDGSKDGEA